MFNFPNSPANGATYAPVGGPTFTWDGTAWKALSQGMPVTVYVSDTAPVDPVFGNLWWESDTGNLYIYYNDGDSAQWVQINGTPAGYQTADTRNRIVNGAMQISQENGTTSVGHAAYPTDQWTFLNTTGATATARQDLLPAASITSRLRVNTTVADASHAATENICVRTAVEGIRIVDFGWGTVNAKPVVLRFAAVAPVAGIYSVAVRNIPSTESWIGSYTIAPEEVGGWVWRTLVIPPCSTGTWASDTSGGLYLLFTIAAGPSNTGVLGWQTANLTCAPGQANGVSVAGNFFVSNVGLYLDPDNTGVAPKWQMPDEAEELRACQRYWARIFLNTGSNPSAGFLYGTAGLTDMLAYSVSFPSVMRVVPSVAGNAVHIYTNSSGGAFVSDQTTTAFRVTVTGSGKYRAQAPASLLIDARM